MASITTNRAHAYGQWMDITLDVSQGGQNLASNYSDVHYSARINGSSGAYFIHQEDFINIFINGTNVYYRGGGRIDIGALKNGTIQVPHNDDGSKTVSYNINARLAGQSVVASGSMTLSNIARAVQVTRTWDTDDSKGSIGVHIYNPANYNTRIYLQVEKEDGKQSVLAYYDEKVWNGYNELPFTQEAKKRLWELAGSRTRCKMFITTKTRVGGKDVFSDGVFWCSINKEAPIINSLYITSNYTGSGNVDTSKIYNLLSEITVRVGSVTPQKNTTIESYTIKYGNKSITASHSSITRGVNIGVPNFDVSGNSPIDTTLTVSATDSRGSVGNKYYNIRLEPYRYPTIKLEAKRKGGFEQETEIKASGTYAYNYYGLRNNRLTNGILQYKEYNGGSWNSGGTLNSNSSSGTFNIPVFYKLYNINKAYYLRIAIGDTMSNQWYFSNEVLINPGKSLVDMDAGNRCLKVDDKIVATIDQVGKIKGATFFVNSIGVNYKTNSYINFSRSDSTDTSEGLFSNLSDGLIKCNFNGVVELSSQLWLRPTIDAWIGVYKNQSTLITEAILRASNFQMLSISPVFINVQKGDTLGVKVMSGSADVNSSSGKSKASYITIKCAEIN